MLCVHLVGTLQSDTLSNDLCRYGQTGSGKTHTLLGTADNPGIAPRACQLLADAIASDPSLTVGVSMVCFISTRRPC
jgi:Kinesin motor domain